MRRNCVMLQRPRLAHRPAAQFSPSEGPSVADAVLGWIDDYDRTSRGTHLSASAA